MFLCSAFRARSRSRGGVAALVLLLCSGCVPGARSPGVREYVLRGQIVAVDPGKLEVTIRHADIPGFMPGMQMAFRVRNAGLLTDRAPGDLVTGTLVVEDTAAHLRTLERTGTAPLPATSTAAAMPPVLTPGEAVTDAPLVDETGRARRLADWRGRALAVTFIYTRCPLPNFCPLMDRHFKAVQDQLRADPALADRVRLLSISIDPEHDTVAVLARHARAVQADPLIWSFLTGARPDILGLASQFGVSVLQEDAQPSEVVHNLRTAVLDPEGKLVTILSGGDWTPRDLVVALGQAHAR